MRPSNFCAKACAPTRTATRSFWNWAASISTTRKKPAWPATSITLALQKWRAQEAAGGQAGRPHLRGNPGGNGPGRPRGRRPETAIGRFAGIAQGFPSKDSLQRSIDEVKTKLASLAGGLKIISEAPHCGSIQSFLGEFQWGKSFFNALNRRSTPIFGFCWSAYS